MAFGYRYWMVFLPEIELHSYLLFVHKSIRCQQATQLRIGQEASRRSARR